MSAFRLACTVMWTELVQAMWADGMKIDGKPGPATRNFVEEIVRGVVTPEPSEWPPFDTAPEKGAFLVYMPEEKRKVQVMYRSNISLIGDSFAFDRKTPTRWHPLPGLPAGETA